MASNYPSSIDSFTDPLVNSPLNSPSHAGLHTDVNDAVEKLETKVGIGASPAASALSGARLIANGTGSSSWQRDGVCTSSTRPSSPYSGQEIYETDTNLKYVWNGSAWYLIGGGTAVANSGLVYIAQGTVTSGASLSVNNCFTSTFDMYKVFFYEFQPSNVGQALRLRLRVGGVDASGGDYYWAYSGIYVNGTSANDTGSAGASLDIGCYNSANSVPFNYSVLDIINPSKVARTYFNTNSSIYNGQFGARNGIGEHNLLTAYDGFSVFPGTGNILALTYKIYGYRQA